MSYFRDGGWGMWAILLGAIAFAAYAATRPKVERSGVLLGGCIFVIIQGVLGMSTGMVAVSRAVAEGGPFAGHGAEMTAVGLGELANCGTFSSFLAMALGLGAIVMRPKRGAVPAA